MLSVRLPMIDYVARGATEESAYDAGCKNAAKQRAQSQSHNDQSSCNAQC